MTFNVFAAIPANEEWLCISRAIKTELPEASILRVTDGDQAMRFLFDRGLLTDDPPSPNLVVLASDLQGVSAESLISCLRDDVRTRCAPVIMFWGRGEGRDTTEAVRAQVGLLTIDSAGAPESQIVDAIYRTCCRALMPAEAR